MADFTQQRHRISVETPLGHDKLLLKDFLAHEEFSRLFHFTLEMASEDRWIDPKQLVGKSVTVCLKYPDDSQRFFNGIVNRFVYQGTHDRYSNYQAEVVPALWLLTRTADCKIFQEKDVPTIIAEVLHSHGVCDFRMALTRSYPRREYCVQYRETAFNFVSRLMEQYGIFYFFRHDDGKHTLVLGDDKSAYEPCQDHELTYRHDFFAGQVNRITDWKHQFEYRPGKWCHSDYNFEAPRLDLKADIKTVVDLPNNKQYEIFDYPGEFVDRSDGEALVRVRMEEEEVPYDVVNGSSLCHSFMPGGKFRVQDHICPAEKGRGYVVTAVTHSAGGADYTTGATPLDRAYENKFTCMPDNVPFRPARTTPKPVVQGAQTAVIVGPPGEEIYPDKYGRVKVQFFWDRYGKKDDKSSCWIRVSQTHAGKGWGHMDIPRVGEEVIVDFLEGDPDRPIITGRVYNAANMPPFALPGGKTRRGNTTKTYKGGGFNEMSMDDTPGAEQIRVHGQHNMDTVVENDQTLKVGVDRMLNIGNNESTTIGSNRTENVGSNEAVTIGSNQQVNVGDNQAITVGNNIVIKAGTSITLQCGAACIHMNQAGVITITGTLITVGGAIMINIAAPITTTSGVFVASTAVASITTGAALNQQLGGTMNVHGADTTVNGGVTNVKGGVTNVQGGTVNIN